MISAIKYLSLGLLVIPLVAQAQACPPAGARYVIKGFTGDTHVTSAGTAQNPKQRCQWTTEDGRELWWRMGEDVVPSGKAAAPSAPALAGKEGASLEHGRVYTCTLPGIGMFTGAYFGIVNDNTYRNFDGKTGRYSFDPATNVLRLTTGSSKGLSYKRVSDNYFRVLDDKGQITGGGCSHATQKRIDGRW